MARSRHRRDDSLQNASASGFGPWGEPEEGYPLGEGEIEASVQQGGGGWPGGISSADALDDLGGLEGVTEGGLGFVGGWGGGHA